MLAVCLYFLTRRENRAHQWMHRPCLGHMRTCTQPPTCVYEWPTSVLCVMFPWLHRLDTTTCPHLHVETTSHKDPGEGVGRQLKNNCIRRKTLHGRSVGVMSFKGHWVPYLNPFLLHFTPSTLLTRNWEGSINNQNMEPYQMCLFDSSKWVNKWDGNCLNELFLRNQL